MHGLQLGRSSAKVSIPPQAQLDTIVAAGANEFHVKEEFIRSPRTGWQKYARSVVVAIARERAIPDGVISMYFGMKPDHVAQASKYVAGIIAKDEKLKQSMSKIRTKTRI